MEGMTDKQFDTCRSDLLRLVLEMLKSSESLDEAIAKVEALLRDQ